VRAFSSGEKAAAIAAVEKTRRVTSILSLTPGE
jgi:hypothetical protein